MRVLFLIFLSALHAFAGFEQRQSGARSTALGTASIVSGTGIFASLLNPALLASLQRSEAQIDLVIDPFGIHELSRSGAGAAVRMGTWAAGAAACRFGYQLYNEETFSALAAFRLAGVSAGIALHRSMVTIEGYGSGGTYIADVGTLIQLGPSIRAGTSLLNVTSSSVGRAGDPVPQIFSIGLMYAVDSVFTVESDLRKETSFDPGFCAGVEGTLARGVTLRFGIKSEPAIASGGVGLQLERFGLDVVLTRHPDLGWTSGFSLRYEWGGRHGR